MRDGCILDGHHRKAIADELGLEAPLEVRQVADDREAGDLAVALNCARRHLTRDQLRTVVAAEIDRRPDDSDRAIARRVGCDHKTVGSVRRGGEFPQPSVEKREADLPLLSREQAEAVTDVTKGCLSAAREAAMTAIVGAVGMKIPPVALVGALTVAQHRFERRHPDHPDICLAFRVAFLTPMIEALVDPDTEDFLRRLSERADVDPCSSDVQDRMLAQIESLGDVA